MEVKFPKHTYVTLEGDTLVVLITLVARGDLSSEFTIPVTVAGGTATRKCMCSKGIYEAFSYTLVCILEY